MNMLLRMLMLSALASECASANAQQPARPSPELLEREAEVALALSAAPPHMREGASVYAFGMAGYELVREGRGEVVCLVNRDGQQAGNQVFRPTCWDSEGVASILPVELRVGTLIARGSSAEQIKSDIDAAYARGEFFSPRRVGIAYMLRGDLKIDPVTRDSTILFPPHYMIYAPGLANADVGLSASAHKQSSAWPFVFDGYSGGSKMAYLIVLAAPFPCDVPDLTKPLPAYSPSCATAPP